MHNVEIFEIKGFQKEKLSLYIQILLDVILIGTFIAWCFIHERIMEDIIYGELACLMLTMAYNNKKFFKRKYMTYIYLIFSVILIGSIVVDIIW